MITTTTVRALRKRLGVSQPDLADLLGVAVRTVGRLEAAELAGHDSKHLARARAALAQLERDQGRPPRRLRTIGALREQLRASQAELARLLGVSTKTLQRWEADGLGLQAQSQGPAGSRSTYALMVLARLKERLQAGELEELQAIVALAEADLKAAMARLMGTAARERRAS